MSPHNSSHLHLHPHYLQSLLQEIQHKTEQRTFPREEAMFLSKLYLRLEKTMNTALWFLDGAERQASSTTPKV